MIWRMAGENKILVKRSKIRDMEIKNERRMKRLRRNLNYMQSLAEKYKKDVGGDRNDENKYKN